MIIKTENLDNYKLDFAIITNKPFSYKNLAEQIDRNYFNLGRIFRGQSCSKPIAKEITNLVNWEVSDLFD